MPERRHHIHHPLGVHKHMGMMVAGWSLTEAGLCCLAEPGADQRLGLQREVEQLTDSPPDDMDAERRQDLTHLTAWAVDSADTTEVDDAVGVESLPDGRRRLWVHVADPTRWLTPGSALDAESRRRTSTLYLPTGMSVVSARQTSGRNSIAAATWNCTFGSPRMRLPKIPATRGPLRLAVKGSWVCSP